MNGIQMNKISIDEQGFIMDLSNDPLFLTFNGKACIMDWMVIWFLLIAIGKIYIFGHPKFE